MTTRLLRSFRILAALLLLAALLSAAVQAEEQTGSVHVLLTGEDGKPTQGISVLLYRVADADGALSANFSATGVTASDLSDTEQQAKIARKLAAYAAEHGCAAKKLTTDAAGEATFASLQEGIYLIRCADGQSVIFPAFLVRLPLELDGKLYYEVDAFPKSEPAPQPEPTNPTAPTEPNGKPDIPQTGWDPLPALLLAAGGFVLLWLGVLELIRSRKEPHA